MSKVSLVIFGGGRFGQELAKEYKGKALSIVRSQETTEKIENQGLSAEPVDLFLGNTMELILEKYTPQILVVSLAPRSPYGYKETYLEVAHKLASIKDVSFFPEKLVVVSSTSVYGEREGGEVNEETTCFPVTEGQNLLREMEEVYLREMQDKKLLILRFGELIKDRSDIYKRLLYAQGPFPGDGSSFCNFTFLKDGVRACLYALEKDMTGVINVVMPDHPTRKEVYEKIAGEKGLPPPIFNPKLTSVHRGNKKVYSKRLEESGFIFSSF